MIFCTLIVAALLQTSHAGGGAGWTYKTTSSTCLGNAQSPCGPAYWYKAPSSSACQNNASSTQSPIDIVTTTVDYNLTNIFPLTPTYGGCNEWYQFATNSTFEISFSDPMCYELQMNYQGVTWTLAQIHFHSPSEHTIAGGFYSAEAHLVHAAIVNGIQKYLVLGVFLQQSAVEFMPSNNTFLQNLWNQGNPSSTIKGIVQAGEVNSATPVNPYNTFLPARRSYYTYPGSFTTPPCTQSVTWIVFDEPVMISPDDLSILRGAFAFYEHNQLSSNGNNNRYPQMPVNTRTVRYYIGYDQATAPPPADDYVINLLDDDDNIIQGTNTAVGAVALAGVCILILAVAFLFYKVNQLQSLLAWESNKNRQPVELGSANNPITK